jgi:hypothetical protein
LIFKQRNGEPKMVDSTNKTTLGYVKEVTPGTIPVTPAFQLLPITGTNLVAETSTVVSEVLRSDRQTDDLIPVDETIGGTTDAELSYDAYKPLMISLLQTADAGPKYSNGAEVADSYTFRKILHAKGTDYPFYYLGCQIGQMVFNFETASLLSMSMDVMGRTSSTTPPGDEAPDVPVAAYDLLNSVSSTDIVISGLPASTEFETMTLTVNNNINPAKAIGTLGSIDLASFTLDVTGDVSLYFEDLSAYNAFKNATNFSITITITDATGNIMVIALPYCKFETLTEPVDGKDEFLMETGTFRALRDPVNDEMISFTFTDAP